MSRGPSSPSVGLARGHNFGGWGRRAVASVVPCGVSVSASEGVLAEAAKFLRAERPFAGPGHGCRVENRGLSPAGVRRSCRRYSEEAGEGDLDGVGEASCRTQVRMPGREPGSGPADVLRPCRRSADGVGGRYGGGAVRDRGQTLRSARGSITMPWASKTRRRSSMRRCSSTCASSTSWGSRSTVAGRGSPWLASM